MTPQELKSKWNLKPNLLAAMLCRNQRTVERYLQGEGVTELIEGYCWFLDNWFEKNGITFPPFLMP